MQLLRSSGRVAQQRGTAAACAPAGTVETIVVRALRTAVEKYAVGQYKISLT